MYLKSITISNFRKFRTQNNTIDFVYASDYIKDREQTNNIDIAPKTTLIVGKNNSGKTTVISCLVKLINTGKFISSDFNYDYLNNLLEIYTKPRYFESEEIIPTPTMNFKVIISMENNTDDLVTNIIPFMSIEDVDKSEIEIDIRWSVKDTAIFVSKLKDFVTRDFKSQQFDRFLKLIDESDFELCYYNSNNEKRTEFKLSSLIEITLISANKTINNTCLSSAFSKIIDYRYRNVIGKSTADIIDDSIIDINDTLTVEIKKHHTDAINKSLEKMLSGKKCKILLKSDLNFQKLIQTVLKYEYQESMNSIPEHQYGLGYTNLMMIVAEIITYIEKYPSTSFNSHINIIAIEEPETYMHPQMQELFIKNINDMISSLLETNDKHVNSQIIITTHSAHILNSKIHMGRKFDNIAYITTNSNCASAISINDNILLESMMSNPYKTADKTLAQEKSQTKQSEESDCHSEDVKSAELKNLMFMKKHIKFKVSEMFFADAVIFVEGITEYTLLQFYLSENNELSKYYISIFLVDGAHAKVYEKLIHKLEIPTLIITDIDIKREKWERNKADENFKDKQLTYAQINNDNIADRKSTNDTLKYFYENDSIDFIVKKGYLTVKNLRILSQVEMIQNYYATSFEEAFILTNSNNSILKNVLSQITPNIYNEIMQEGGLLSNSFKFQNKISDNNKKSDFANKLLYEILTCADSTQLPLLPNYINNGFEFLLQKLEVK